MKLIFNPKKDMKELLKYDFTYDKYNKKYELNLSQFEKGMDGLIIYEGGEVNNYTSPSLNGKSTYIFYKLIKQNLIIAENEVEE